MTAVKRVILGAALATIVGMATMAGSAMAILPTFSCEFHGTGVLSSTLPLIPGGESGYSFSAAAVGATPLNFDCLTSDGSGVSVDQLADTSIGAFYGSVLCGGSGFDSLDPYNSVTVTHQSGTEDLSGAYPLDDFAYVVNLAQGVGTFSFNDPTMTGIGPASYMPAGDASQTSGYCTNHFSLVGSVAGTISSDPT